MKSKGRIISNCKQKKTITGFTLIEIIIVITILGITFVFGANYLISFLNEHRIAVQSDFLHREARFALDFIINGTMIKKAPNEFVRYAGIIGAYNVKIKNKEGIDAKKGNEIRLYEIINGADPKTQRIGRILVSSPKDPNKPVLLFDKDQKIGNEDDYWIIPTGASETGLDKEYPYTIGIEFEQDTDNPSLIKISLALEQKISSRKLHVELQSAVYLRNQDPDIILIDDN